MSANPHSSLSHETLLAAIDGDRRAQELAWEQSRGLVRTILRAHAPRDVELDDLVQDVAVRFVGALSDLRDPAAYRSWLRSIALHVARSSGRARTRDRNLRSLSCVEPIDARSESEHESIEWREEIAAALEALTADEQELLTLRSQQGLSQRELGELLGCSERAIESRLARARRALRARLAGPGRTEAAGNEIDTPDSHTRGSHTRGWA
ncbi:MAG: sigma-70 family RNA polymerase sigma factor [Planctomycetota bacterium]